MPHEVTFRKILFADRLIRKLLTESLTKLCKTVSKYSIWIFGIL